MGESLKITPAIWEVATVFGRIGSLGFGGPLAMISMMEEETVRRRQWLTPAKFSEIYAVCKLLPGPLAPQVAMSIARLRAGTLGGFIAGLCFISPAFLFVVILAAFFSAEIASPSLARALTGLQIGAIAVIIGSVVQLAKPHWKYARFWAIATPCAMLTAWRASGEPLYIVVAGLIGAYSYGGLRFPRRLVSVVLPIFLIGPGWNPSVMGELFWVCFKSGAFIFGTGVAIVPLLEADFVERLHWLTHSEFMNAVAVGQMTPGPFIITATYIGFKVAGFAGAIIATFGIFSPAFVNALYLVPKLWQKVAGTPGALGFTAWALPAVVGCLVAACFKLGMGTVTLPTDYLVLGVGTAAVILLRMPAWLVLPLSAVANFIV